MIFLAFFDCSLFRSPNYGYEIIIVMLLLLSIFLWSRYFKQFAVIDENAALPYASDMGVAIYALVELIVLCWQQDYWRVLFLLAFLFLWISGMGSLKKNMDDICDNPIWHWYTYAGLWCTTVDILYSSLFIYYYTKTNRKKAKIDDLKDMSYLRLTDEELTDSESYSYIRGKIVDPFSKQIPIIREEEDYVHEPSGLIITNGLGGKLSPIIEDIKFSKPQYSYQPNYEESYPTPPSITNNPPPAGSPDFSAFDKEEPQIEKRHDYNLENIKKNHLKNSVSLKDGKKRILPSSPEQGHLKSLFCSPDLNGHLSDAESNVAQNLAQCDSPRPVAEY